MQRRQDEPGTAEGSRTRPAGGVEEAAAGRAATDRQPIPLSTRPAAVEGWQQFEEGSIAPWAVTVQ